ncbi:MAG: hypothetical protein IJL94_00185 [Erysipelotrichaceae bacterium]|nr:hypothetical protein [Erysipelotrichaceae bacterium]
MKHGGILIAVFCLLLVGGNVSTGVSSQLREVKSESRQKTYDDMLVFFNDAHVFEYADKRIDTRDFVYMTSEGELTVSQETVDLMEPGKKVLEYVLTTFDEYGQKVEKKYTHEITVQDTVDPVIELKQGYTTVVVHHDFDPKENIESVTDAVTGDLPYSEELLPGTYTIESNVDCHTIGNYRVTVKAMDPNGNQTEQQFSVIVNFGTYEGKWNGQRLNRVIGTIAGPSGKETYYNLNMDGVIAIMRRMGNTDPYWIREDGVKMLGDYVMVAANLHLRPRGSYVLTSLGMGIVCDTGGFAYYNPYQLDIAVDW